MKERMKALSDMEETQLLKEIETSGRELTQRFGLEAIVITGVEVSGSDGRARMGNLVLEKEKADWCFSVKEGGSYSGICSECGNGERDSHESMCGEGC